MPQNIKKLGSNKTYKMEILMKNQPYNFSRAVPFFLSALLLLGSILIHPLPAKGA